MNEQQTIEQLAKILWRCGRCKEWRTDCVVCRGSPTQVIDAGFNPIEDWNQFRVMEELVIKKGLANKYLEEIAEIKEGDNVYLDQTFYMKADLPTRCQALVSVLSGV